MEHKSTTIQAASKETVGKHTVVRNTAVESTVDILNRATLSDNNVREHDLKEI